jgi:rhamnose utilization protein RhaD (predicted bifunctional aldolase and dehydrogenase)
MPGFALAKLASEVFERDRRVEGLLLLKHGLFTFASSARESYERHIRAVHAAETFAEKRRYWSVRSSAPPSSALHYNDLAPVLRGLLGEGQRRYTLHLRQSKEIADFITDPKLDALSQVGCATPDHVIRTKRFPLLLKLDPGRPSGSRATATSTPATWRVKPRARASP